MSDRCSMIVSSGTEQKIKIYYSVKCVDKIATKKKLGDIQNTIQTKLGLK